MLLMVGNGCSENRHRETGGYPSVGLAGPFEFREETPLRYGNGSTRGHAVLGLVTDTVAIGGKVTADIRFHNENGADWFYNAFLNRLVPLPCALVLYDSSRKYIGNLLADVGGSRKSVGASNWVYVGTESYVGTTVTFRAGYVPYTKHDTVSNPLPAGDYLLQVVFFEPFVAPNPARLYGTPQKTERESVMEFCRAYNQTELFRSNVTKLTIRERPEGSQPRHSTDG
jgi:hypothetical protein